MALYWLSFCNMDKPEGSRFAGACIVEAPYTGDSLEARRADNEMVLRAAWRHKCNPGGEVQSMRFPDEAAALIPEAFKYVLMSKERCDQFDRLMAEKTKALKATK